MELFMEHVANFGLSYGTIEEFNFRKNIYDTLSVELDQINLDHANFTVAHNHLSTWTTAEKKRLLGYRASGIPTEEVFEVEQSNVEWGSSKDWRQDGAVTDVKDQGSCGSCWSFSTTGNLEGAHFIASGRLESFSEQQLVDCSNLNHACQGGSMALALMYFENHDAIKESDYPYTSGTSRRAGTCAYDYKPHTGVRAQSHSNVQRSETGLRNAIARGPVSVAVEADKAVFSNYHSGVLDSTLCGTQLDHGILAVGYGTEGGQDYFLVKNSWSSSWGDEGYIKIAAEGNICGIYDGAVESTAN